MSIKHFLSLLIFIIIFSCAEDNDITTPRNLQEYLDVNYTRELDTIIAKAASASGSEDVTYIYFYPIDGATEIRYYETENVTANKSDFINYRRKNLNKEAVFGEKLSRFTRSGLEDSWGIVTYLTNGKLHISDPIQLKIKSKPTKWTKEVSINYSAGTTNPTFTWSDFSITDNINYFQIIYDEKNADDEEEFISGTFTKEKKFQFYDTSSTSTIISNINEGILPNDLIEDEEYIFNLMGISEDNWVNLMIQKSFVPRNLKEYVASKTATSINSVTAFAVGENNNKNIAYIYYYPIEGATDIRYYETENTNVDKDNLTNYRRNFLSSDKIYGGKLSRFSRSNSAESWCIVTYLVNDKLHTSKPIKIKIATNATKWTTELKTINFDETLKPKFTWEDDNLENTKYFQVLTDEANNYLSGNFVLNPQNKTFQYNESVTSRIDGAIPPKLIFDDTYKFTIMGLSEENWVDLVIQYTFIVQ